MIRRWRRWTQMRKAGEQQIRRYPANLCSSTTSAVFFLFVVAIALASSGCLAPTVSAGRDADSSVAGLRADVREMNTALLQLKTDVRAGRDVNTNDTWTLRLLGLGVMLLGLSYPVGKMLWLASGAIQRKARWIVLAASRARTDQIRSL